jgi:hydrogenase expression/formation protein HypC
MCVGIPMQVVSVDGFQAECRDGEVTSRVNLMLLDETPGPGAWVLVHLGNAVRSVTPTEAGQIRDALEAVERAARGEDFEHLFADLIDREPPLPDHLRTDREDET